MNNDQSPRRTNNSKVLFNSTISGGVTPKKASNPSMFIPSLSTCNSTISKVPLLNLKTSKNLQLPELHLKTLPTDYSDRSHHQSRNTPSSSRIVPQFSMSTARPQLEDSKLFSPRMGSFTDRYSNFITDTALEPIKEKTLLADLIRGLDKFIKGKDTMTMLMEGKRKESSIKVAKRVIYVVLRNLRALRNRKAKSLGSPNDTESVNVSNEVYIIFEKLNSVVNELLPYCDQAMNVKRSKGKLDAIVKEMYEIGQKSENSELSLQCYYVQGQLLMKRNEYAAAINHFKQYKQMCKVERVVEARLKAYRCLGKCYQELQKYKTALLYFIKFLNVAWYLNSGKHELLAYDFIGLQYYYLGQLEKANYYHSRMVGGTLEPDNSNIKQIGVRKVKLSLEKEIIAYQTKQNGIRNQQIKLAKSVKEFKQDAFDDELTKEGDFELPIQSFGHQDEKVEDKSKHLGKDKPEEDESNKHGNDLNSADHFSIRKKKSTKVVVGLMKAKVAQMTKEKAKEKHRVLETQGQKNFMPLATTERIKKLAEERAVFKSLSAIKSKPDEPIIVSHLSRNRQLKNFATFAPYNIQLMGPDQMEIDYNDFLDEKTSARMKKVLEKFQINLLVIRQMMHAFQGYLQM